MLRASLGGSWKVRNPFFTVLGDLLNVFRNSQVCAVVKFDRYLAFSDDDIMPNPVSLEKADYPCMPYHRRKPELAH